jgi:hypothetical protein
VRQVRHEEGFFVSKSAPSSADGSDMHRSKNSLLQFVAVPFKYNHFVI